MSEDNFVADLWYAADIKGRVENGAKWLDYVKPGWHKLIDLSGLDMQKGDACICGQVFMEEVNLFNMLNDKDIDHGYAYFTLHLLQEKSDDSELSISLKASRLGFNYLPVNEIMFDHEDVMSDYEYSFDKWYGAEMSLLAEEWVLEIQKRTMSDHTQEKG